MEVILSKYIGYCFGVNKAIEILFDIQKRYINNDIYLFGELIHNSFFVEELKKKNIKIVSFNDENAIAKLNSFKKGDIVIFSAHGHDKKFDEILINNGVTFFDATCPIVSKNLSIIENLTSPIIFIGKKGHPETDASLAHGKNIYLYDINSKFDYPKIDDESPLVLNQTTLSILELKEIIEDIKKHYKNAKFVDEICMQTKFRQNDVIETDDSFDLLVVVGDKKSSNSRKLFEVAKAKHTKKLVLFVENLSDLKQYNISNCSKAKIFSGTSTPLVLIKEIEEYLKRI